MNGGNFEGVLYLQQLRGSNQLVAEDVESLKLE